MRALFHQCRCWTPARAAPPSPSPSAASATCCSPGRTRPGLARKEFGADEFDIVYPSLSILAEPPVAVVDKVVDKKGTRAVAEAYLNFLYTAEGQTIVRRTTTGRANPRWRRNTPNVIRH